MNIAAVGTDEWPEIMALLGANGLPTEDLSHGVVLLGVRDERGLEGVVGIEPHGETALLRSLAVRPDRRQSGLGSALVHEAERLAVGTGIRALFLLTTTAEAFFAHRGYVREPRDQAPLAIQRTREFASLCPSSAAFMRKSLHAEPA
jgi:amino-acid N-acetyltransferase